jgi:hypothetical protein
MKQRGKMKPLFKFTIMGILAVGAFFVVSHFIGDSDVFQKETKDGEVIVDANATILPDAPLNQEGKNVVFAGLPTSTPANVNSTPISMKIMAWNSQMGLIYANGGKKTTKGSLMEKNNVNLTVTTRKTLMQLGLTLSPSWVITVQHG